MIDIQTYLKRVSEGSNVNVSNGYNAMQGNQLETQQQGYDSSLPANVFQKNGQIDFKKLEKFYSSRSGVHEEMTAWSPVDGKVHSLTGDSTIYQFEHPILHANTLTTGFDKIQTSSSIMSNTEIDNALYNAFPNEYADKFAELIAQTPGETLHEKIVNLVQHGSGIITSADYTDLNTAIMNAQMVTKTSQAMILASLFPTETTNDIAIYFDEFDAPTVQEDLAEMEIPDTVQGRYTGFSLGLKKDGFNIAWTRLAAGIPRRRNVIADNLDALSGDFARVINERLAATLELLPTQAGGTSWSAFTAPTDFRNTNNPLAVINTARAALKAAKFPMNLAISNLRVAQDYANNSNVKGELNGQPTQFTGETVGPLPKYPDSRLAIEDGVADSTFYVLNLANAITRIQGAVINITYTNQKSQVFGAIGYNWNNAAVKKSTAGFKITGIT